MNKILWVPCLLLAILSFYGYFFKTLFEKVELSCLNGARRLMDVGNLNPID